MRPILISKQTLRPSERLTVVAGALAQSSPHAARFIVQGPGYRGQYLSRTRSGIAAASITLPSALASGTWAIAAEDLSQLKAGPNKQVTGLALLDLGIFAVGHPRPGAQALAGRSISARPTVILTAARVSSVAPLTNPGITSRISQLCTAQNQAELAPYSDNSFFFTGTIGSYLAAFSPALTAEQQFRSALASLPSNGRDKRTLAQLVVSEDALLSARAHFLHDVLGTNDPNTPLDLNASPEPVAVAYASFLSAFATTSGAFLAAGVPSCARPWRTEAMGPGASEATGATVTDRFTSACSSIDIAYVFQHMGPPEPGALTASVGSTVGPNGQAYDGGAGPINFSPGSNDVVFVHNDNYVITSVVCTPGSTPVAPQPPPGPVPKCVPAANVGNELGQLVKKPFTIPAKTIDLPRNLPGEVTASISTLEGDVCQAALSSHLAGSGLSAGFEFGIEADSPDGLHPVFDYSLPELTWTTHPGSPPQDFATHFDAAQAEVKINPSLSFDLKDRSLGLTIATVALHALRTEVTLIRGGRALLQASVGPTLELDAKLGPKDPTTGKDPIEQEVENKVQEGEDPQTAIEDTIEEVVGNTSVGVEEQAYQFEAVDLQAEIEAGFRAGYEPIVDALLSDPAFIARISPEPELPEPDISPADGAAVDETVAAADVVDVSVADDLIFLLLL